MRVNLLGGGEGAFPCEPRLKQINLKMFLLSFLIFSSDAYENLDSVRSDRYLKLSFLVLNQKFV